MVKMGKFLESRAMDHGPGCGIRRKNLQRLKRTLVKRRRSWKCPSPLGVFCKDCEKTQARFVRDNKNLAQKVFQTITFFKEPLKNLQFCSNNQFFQTINFLKNRQFFKQSIFASGQFSFCRTFPGGAKPVPWHCAGAASGGHSVGGTTQRGFDRRLPSVLMASPKERNILRRPKTLKFLFFCEENILF